MPYFLQSQRIGFRPWTAEDFPLAQSLWGDPSVSRYLVAGGQFSSEQITERFDRERKTLQEHGFQYWPMFLLADDTFLGCCGLRPYQMEKGMAEFGVHLCPAARGQGYAVEAGRCVIVHAFETLKLSSLFAGHHPDNDASRRMLTKLGFRFTHAQRYPPTGLMHPSYVLDAGDLP